MGLSCLWKMVSMKDYQNNLKSANKKWYPMICPICNHDMEERNYLGVRFNVCRSCGNFYQKGYTNDNNNCPVCHNPHSGYCYTCGVHIRP